MAVSRGWSRVGFAASLLLGGALASPAAVSAAPSQVAEARALARCQWTISRDGVAYANRLGWRLERCLRPTGACALAGHSGDDHDCRVAAAACGSLPDDVAALDRRLKARLVNACSGAPPARLTSDLGFAAALTDCPVTSVLTFTDCLTHALRAAQGALFARLEPVACRVMLAGGPPAGFPADLCGTDASGPSGPSGPGGPTPPSCTAPLYCGGPNKVACPDGQVCDRSDMLCTNADAAGVCVPAPTGCPAGGTRVCGCDGTTYDSDCARLVAGATRAHEGACDPLPTGCVTSLDCPAGEFCEFPSGDCGEGQSGTCHTTRAASCALCTAFVTGPVCGCDGTTYATDCERAAAGISKWFNGSCP